MSDSIVTKIAQTNGYIIQCINCHNSIKIYPPGPQYEIILTQPCPMCNGLEQSFDCKYCGCKNTIYRDERHFVRRRGLIRR
jgi:hypothetical protein